VFYLFSLKGGSRFLFFPPFFFPNFFPYKKFGEIVSPQKIEKLVNFSLKENAIFFLNFIVEKATKFVQKHHWSLESKV